MTEQTNPPPVDNKPLGDFKSRVIDEQKELAMRITKLGAFITSDKVMELEAEDRQLLVEQYIAMQSCHNTLLKRIARF